jgi:hypothetical protein
MSASSAGKEAKGCKHPTTMVRESGAREKGLCDEKLGGFKAKYARKLIMGGDSEQKKEEESKSSRTYGKWAGGIKYDKKNPTEGLQQIVNRREQEIKEIEEKMDTAADGREKATLGVQLKGAQHALKEALVNISLVQRKEEVLCNKTPYEDGEKMMNEDDPKDRGQGTKINAGVNNMEVEDRLMEMTIYDTEMELTVHDCEGRSDDEDGSDRMEWKQRHKKHKKDNKEEVIDLTMINEFNNPSTQWGDTMSDNKTVLQTNMEDNNNEWQIATNKNHKKPQESNNKKQEKEHNENE